jgi:hypothetical protein
LPEQKWFAGSAEHAGYAILHLRYYPAWAVRVNGIPVTALAEQERGLMAVPVPKGNVLISVAWSTTGDVVAGRWVSAASLLLVTGLFFFEQKRLPHFQSLGRSSSPTATDGPKPTRVEPKLSVSSAHMDRQNKPSSNQPKTATPKKADKSKRGE